MKKAFLGRERGPVDADALVKKRLELGEEPKNKNLIFDLLHQHKQMPLDAISKPVLHDYPPILLGEEDGEEEEQGRRVHFSSSSAAAVADQEEGAEWGWGWDDQDKQDAQLGTQLIGALDSNGEEAIAPHFFNPMAPTGVIWDETRQEYVARINYNPGPAPNNQELMDRLTSISGGNQQVYDKLPLVPDIINPAKWLETSTQGRAMSAERPHYIRPGDFPLWPRVPVCFPVYVGYPHFGAGLVMAHIALNINNTGAEQYFAVVKMTPLGYVQGAPFNGGVWSVKASWCLRMPVAVMDLVPVEDLVSLVNDRGERWGESFTAFSRSKRWEYKVARDALVRDFPSLLGPVMCTRLRVGRPEQYKRDGPINYPSRRTRTIDLREAARTRGEDRTAEDDSF